MSNNAIRILYEGLNALPDVRCERVFAPAPDFAELLARKKIPLYTLESGIPLNSVDMVGFSVGYELCATNMLSVLDTGGVPIRRKDRCDSDPIVIAGGPAITNPHPFSIFLDAVWIGEAETGFYNLIQSVAALKRRGEGREGILQSLGRHPAMWKPRDESVRSEGRVLDDDVSSDRESRKAVRSIFAGFSGHAYSTALPLPTTKTVQDHGTVEIMRGCPNGCRFCHAGYFYRPQRIKSRDVIFSEVERLVREGGYREITLASLSSGDYPKIGELIGELNRRWAPRRISFQLPSLKVDSFTLPLLEQLSEVRKSGLTFAVETPVESWQASINKAVTFEKTVAILEEARNRGFRQAKFYFMIGLPVSSFGLGEADAIIAFLEKISHATSLALTVNIGTFVPKPHTPFERSAQLSENDAFLALSKIKNSMRRYKNIKVSYHSPFTSLLEGIISRGDDNIGEIIIDAYRRGARLDAWEEHFDRELWKSVLDARDDGSIPNTLAAKSEDQVLPWSDISIRVSSAYLMKEAENSTHGIYTSSCTDNCTSKCGSCTEELHVEHNYIQEDILPITNTDEHIPPMPSKSPRTWVVLSYAKKGVAAYYQHLSIIEFFSRAFIMHDVPVAYSEGFNPMPRIETTPPLTIGAESLGEVMQIPLEIESIDPADLVETLNKSLPDGLRVLNARVRTRQVEGIRHRSIGSLYAASEFRVVSDMEGLTVPLETPGFDMTAMQMRDEEIARMNLLIKHLTEIGATSISRIDARTSEFLLPDKSGGEFNLVRILEKLTPIRPALRDFKVTRLSTKLLDEGSLKDIFSFL